MANLYDPPIDGDEVRVVELAEKVEHYIQNAPINHTLFGAQVDITQVRKNSDKRPGYFAYWFAKTYYKILDFEGGDHGRSEVG